MAGDALFGTGTSRSVSTLDDDNLVNTLRNIFQIARDHKRVRYDNWIRNYRLVHNRLASRAAAWMPAPRDSEVYPTLSALVAWMTDQNTNVDFVPAANPNNQYYSDFLDLANDLSDIIYSTWLVENYDGQIKLALWDTFMYGLGVLKTTWDNQLDDGYGNSALRRCDPWTWYPDPNATSLDDMEYCIEVRRMSLDEIERRWPHARAFLEAGGESGDQYDERPNLFLDTTRTAKANPGSIPTSGTFGSIGSSGIGNFGGTSRSNRLWNPMPGYVVYEFWLKQNRDSTDPESLKDDYAERVVNDEWRVIVMCNNHILMDDRASDLWRHGQHPYDRLVFDDIGEMYGISLVDHLADPQIYINRLLTAMQHNAELVGNPIFIEGASGGTSRVGIHNRPGQRLTIQGPGGMRDNKPDWLRPPEMPQSVMNLVEFWIGRIENTSGLSAIVKGATPNQRNAEGVMTSVQEAAFVRIRSALKNLEYCLQSSIIKAADLIVENYTEPRIVAIVGQDGSKSAKDLKARHFYGPTSHDETPMKFILQVQAGASAPTSRQARVAEADKLFAMRAVDDQYLLEAHQIRNIPEILIRKYIKQLRGLAGGGGAPNQRTATRAPGMTH